MKLRIGFALVAPALASLALVSIPAPALAAFHLMQIDQVIGGVAGDTTAQAVQLVMRTTFQNQLAGDAQLVVRDATGANPMTLSTFPMPNPTEGACLAILLATPSFAAKTAPAAVANYTMTPIPSTYLPAGSLTFESLGGATTYWRLSWGAYSGPQTVATGFNDDDGVTSPAVPGALPSTSAQALVFSPGCPSGGSSTPTGPGASTTNASQYALTGTAAVFTNNAGATFTVQAPPPVPGLPGRSHWLLPVLLCVGVLGFAVARRARRIV